MSEVQVYTEKCSLFPFFEPHYTMWQPKED